MGCGCMYYVGYTFLYLWAIGILEDIHLVLSRARLQCEFPIPMKYETNLEPDYVPNADNMFLLIGCQYLNLEIGNYYNYRVLFTYLGRDQRKIIINNFHTTGISTLVL